MPPEPKTCLACGRRIEWRKKWERDWDEVRYCSTSCRRHGVTEADRELETTLVRRLGPGRKSTLDLDGEPERRAARRLVAGGGYAMVQKGRVVDPSTARGPVQLRRA